MQQVTVGGMKFNQPGAGSFRSPRGRATMRPPLSWLNGIAFAEYTYVGERT